jgi:hypothetical protein
VNGSFSDNFTNDGTTGAGRFRIPFVNFHRSLHKLPQGHCGEEEVSVAIK